MPKKKKKRQTVEREVELKPKNITIPKVLFFCTTEVICTDGQTMELSKLRMLRDIANKTGSKLVNIDYERFFPHLVEEFDKIMARHNLPEVYSYLVDTTLEVDPEKAVLEWIRINPTEKFLIIYNKKWEEHDHFRTIDPGQLLYCETMTDEIKKRAIKILGEN